MKNILLGLLIILNSCTNGQNNNGSSNLTSDNISSQLQQMFPKLKSARWDSTGQNYIAFSNFITLVPDSIHNLNGELIVTFTKDKKWFSTYRHFVEFKDINQNIPSEILEKISSKLLELGGKEIGNIGITQCGATDCTIPSGAMYAVFGVNPKTNDMDRYYFNSEGEFIKWR